MANGRNPGSGSFKVGGRVSINEGRTVKGGVIPTGTLPTRPAAPAPSKGSSNVASTNSKK